MLPPEIAERQLINSIVDKERLQQCLDNNIGSEHFAFPPNQEVWNFIKDYYDKYRQLVSREVLEETFPKFRWGSALPIIPCIEEIKRQYSFSQLLLFFEKTKGELKTQPDQFIHKALTEFSKLNRQQNVKSMSIVDKDAKDRRLNRLIEKQRMKREKGILGIPTGIETIDMVTQGWRPGHLIAWVARPEMGKSSMLTYFSVIAHNKGHKIVFISPEMTKEELEDLIDTIYANMLFGKEIIDRSSLVSGGNVDLELYESYLNTIGNDGRFVVYDSAAGKTFDMNFIDSVVEQHQPDLLIIDGIGFISGANGGISSSDWRDFNSIATECKNIANNRKIAVLVASHANREVGNDSSVHPTPSQVAGGDGLYRSADFMFSLAHPKQDADRDEMRTIKMIKTRGTAPLVDLIYIDFKMNYGIIKERSDFEYDE